MIAIWNAISNAFAQAKSGISFVPSNTRELTILNNIGHASRVELLIQEQVNGVYFICIIKSLLINLISL